VIAVKVTVPIACFRKGLAREYLETEPIPPPSTCYGFLLSLVGEFDRYRHIGVRICPVLVGEPELSVVLRTIWRVKKAPLGSPGNTRPDFQQLLSSIDLFLWIDSSDEKSDLRLEQRVLSALQNPETVERSGGLSMGESTHLVNEVLLLSGQRAQRFVGQKGQAFLLNENGNLALPVWVDHVGSAQTRYATGSLISYTYSPENQPRLSEMPCISDIAA
jgi:CRISPR-associated protein Cas5t